ncbi:unnamed protein product [Cyprideis torosa]|uniref:Importin subunit alpha n=1 Tax=Cyprideis torosa TaxID=163714 RepID=A0A7R8W1Y6_9CRUS|nr:unnamed protein product [Cyprideis torosa]CAG0880354.1 unnamed protein product [Cyprideis torosa]
MSASDSDPNRSRRQQQYKNAGGKTADDLRRKRQEHSVELRKKKVDEQLMKKRNIYVEELETSPGRTAATDFPVWTLDEISAKMISQNQEEVFNAEIIRAGLVPKFVKLLDVEDAAIQFECAWALTNIASGSSDETRVVVDSGAVDGLIRLLRSPHENLTEQATWALGNIAGDGPIYRDLVLEKGIVPAIVNLIRNDTPTAFLRNIAWTLSNLCRNKNPPPPFEAVQQCIPTFAQLIFHSDREVISDVCWAMSYITDGPNEKIETVVQTGIVPKLVELMQSPELSIATPALRTCGNIVTGNDSQTDEVIAAGGVMVAKELLCHSKQSVVKEAAWLISNVMAGNQLQIQAAIDAKTLPLLVNVVKTGDHRSKKEAAWALTNVTSGGSPAQMVDLCEHGAIDALCVLLDEEDPRTLLVALEGLGNLLKTADGVGKASEVALAIEQCGGLDKIEALQNHVNEDIYKKSYDLIRRYFPADDEEDEGDSTLNNEEAQGATGKDHLSF